jgi:hypothetical protein
MRVSEGFDCQCFLLRLSSVDGDAVLNPTGYIAVTVVQNFKMTIKYERVFNK